MSAPTYDLGKLHGGLRLPGTQGGIDQLKRYLDIPVPKQLVLPITQHVGDPAQPLVEHRRARSEGPADRRSREGALGAPVHASSSGTSASRSSRGRFRAVMAIKRRALLSIATVKDEASQRKRMTAATIESSAPTDLLNTDIARWHRGPGRRRIPDRAETHAGAHLRRSTTLLLNGVECESYISCDDLLMRERASEIISGAQILMHALQIDVCFLAVESDKPDAIRILAEALGEKVDERIVLKQVPTIYPSGGEDQLVQLVTNREVPSGGLPTDVGCLVQNVGTAAAIHDWIINSQPLTSRVTTVTGDGVVNPINVRARIGTPIADVVPYAGGYTDTAEQLIIGGPMTGRSVTTDRVPVVKATNCILVLSQTPDPGPELPCIRCGDCASVCPVQLLPQQLFWYACADNEVKLREFGITDCIECGCCDLVCPSHIPLTADFRVAKGRIQELADEKSRAARARQRFESRNDRLEREKTEREQQLAQQKASARQAGPSAISEILKRKKQERDTPDNEGES